MQENVHRENRLSPFAGAGCRRFGGRFHAFKMPDVFGESARALWADLVAGGVVDGM